MIRKVIVGGLKAFGPKPVEVELAPLTLVVGENGAGKTTLFEALGLLAQSAGRDRVAWSRDSGNRRVQWVALPAQPKALHRTDAEGELSLGLEVVLPDRLARREFSAQSVAAIEGPLRYCFQHREAAGNWDEWEHVLAWGGHEARSVHRLASRVMRLVTYRNELAVDGQLLNWVQPPAGVLTDRIFRTGTQDNGEKLAFAQLGVELLAEFLDSAFSYIGPERGPSSIAWEIGGDIAVPRSVGKKGEDTLRLLASVLNTDERAADAEKIRHWSEQFALSRLSAGWRGGVELGCDFRDPQTGTVVQFDLSGYGSAQILPVIVELFGSPEGATILVEEPEISLHPKAVARLPELFADAVRSGRQLVLSTHSEVLLSELHRAVKAGVPTGDILVLELRRTSDGVTASPRRLDDKGLLVDWPASFRQAESESSKALFDIVGHEP